MLIASYYFPPDAAVGGLRAAKFVRALPAFGWQPIVLTVKQAEDGRPMDAGRLEGLDDVPVVRTREFAGLTTVYLAVKARLRGRRVQAVAASAALDASASGSMRDSLGSRLKRYVISLILLLPDQEKGWSLTSAETALRLIRKDDIDCLLTSAPPASLHFIGLLAKALTRAKWVADFRDPWLESLDGRPSSARSRLSDAIERRMEHAVVRHADIVVATTDRMAEALRSRYPALQHKVVCVPNSIDSNKFRPSAALPKYDRLTITYAGTLYEGRTPEPLFAAIGRLLREGRISPSDVRVKLVGHCASIDGVDTRTVARRHGVESIVEVVEPMPYSEAIRVMQRSHLLLVLSPAHHRLIVPAKLYDYLGSGSKILAIAEPGAATDLIDETASGRWFLHADVDGIRDYLCSLITNRTFADLKNDAASFARFDVSFLAGRLAAHMSSVCSSTVGSPAEAHGR